jgi:hypothetical protein
LAVDCPGTEQEDVDTLAVSYDSVLREAAREGSDRCRVHLDALSDVASDVAEDVAVATGWVLDPPLHIGRRVGCRAKISA